MIKKNLDQIAKSDFDNLLINKVPEGIQLDYKQKFNRDPQDVAKDLSAMANTEGGDYILGVVEARNEKDQKLGYPEKIEGIAWTEEKLKEFIETAVLTRIEPRLPTLGYREIEGYEGGSVFVIRVPKSRMYPHLIYDQHKISFAKRGPYGNYWLDSKDMRYAIIHGSNTAEQIRTFINERIELNKSVYTGANGKARMLIHVLGTSSLEGLHQIEWDDLKSSRNELSPLTWSYDYPTANVDGFVTTANTNQDTSLTKLLVTREGYTELLTIFFCPTREIKGVKRDLVQLKYSIGHIVKHIAAMGKLFKTLGVQEPIYACISLIDCESSSLAEIWEDFYDRPRASFGRKVIVSPILELTGDALDQDQVRSDTRPIFEFLAQAGGKTVSDYYDQYGQVREDF